MNSPFVIDMNFAAIVTGTYMLTQYIHCKWLHEKIRNKVLHKVITHPKTDSLSKHMDEVPIMTICTEFTINKDECEVVEVVRYDVNLKSTGYASDCSDVVEGLLEYNDDFMTNSMDNIMITNKMCFKILTVKYDNRVHNRSIIIDIGRYRDEYAIIRRNLTFKATIVMAILMSNRDIREFIGI